MCPLNNLDRYCRTCGYNLRGLAGDDVRCPECGQLNRPCTRYAVVRHIWRFGTHYSVLDDARRRVFTFRARHLTLGRDYDLLDARGETLLRIVQRHGTLTTSFDILRDGRYAGAIQHKALSIRHHEFNLKTSDTGRPDVECVCARRRWKLRREEEFVAEVTKPWFAWLYAGQRVEIACGEDTPLILGAVLTMDAVLGRA